MKKLISIFTALSIISAVTTCNTYAENTDFTGNTEIVSESNEEWDSNKAIESLHKFFDLEYYIPDRSKKNEAVDYKRNDGSIAWTVYQGTNVTEEKRERLADFFHNWDWKFSENTPDTNKSHTADDYIEFTYVSDTEIKDFIICYYDEAYFFSYNIPEDKYENGGVYQVDYELFKETIGGIFGTDPTQHNGISFLAQDSDKEKTINEDFDVITLASSIPDYKEISDKKNADLKSLASSLGADTDYFSFPNYPATEVGDEIFAKVKSEHQVNAEGAFQECQGGLCNGFAVLEVLNHNGVISPSDIQEGAENLHDIVFDSHVNDMLCYYSILQNYKLQELAYHEYFCSHNLEEQCQDLIKFGQQAMDTGKYFFIAFKGTNISHSIVGIGIADGNWTYNDKNYDKCILTLDSNFVKSSDSSKSAGFDEKGCIYINSETNEFYFPAYKSDSANEDTFITLLTDDTDMLNYQGFINPSESFNLDYELIKELEIHHLNCGEYDLTIELDGNSETYHGYPKTVIDNITKNAWSPLGESLGAKYFRKLDSVSIEMNDDESLKYGKNLSLTFLTQDVYSNINYIYLTKKSNGIIENNKLTYTNLYEDVNEFSLYATRNNNSIPYHGFGVSGKLNASASVSMEILDDGIIISTTDDMIKCNIDFHKFNYDENDEYIGDYSEFKVFSLNDVMIKCKENSDDIYFTIGENFDITVKKGDVNCDGNVDASDASAILSAYSDLSTGKNTYLNDSLADFNNDGMLDASDASDVLAEYARLSTT